MIVVVAVVMVAQILFMFSLGKLNSNLTAFGESLVEFIQEIEGTMTYELPAHLLGIIWKGKYRGQKQKWFVIKF